jgi:hypothetical protein
VPSGRAASKPAVKAPPVVAPAPQMMGKPAIGKDTISMSGGSPAKSSNPLADSGAKERMPSPEGQKGKDDDAGQRKTTQPSKRGEQPKMTPGPLAKNPLAERIGGPVVPGVAPGMNNGGAKGPGYYNEFNYPTRLARPRGFSLNASAKEVGGKGDVLAALMAITLLTTLFLM